MPDEQITRRDVLGTPMRAVVQLLPSAVFPNAEVAELECGHSHVRPIGYLPKPNSGRLFQCCFCADGELSQDDLRAGAIA